MVDGHTALEVEEILAFPLIMCPRDFADGEFRHHIQPFSLLTSSSLEPIYSFGTERNVIGQFLSVTSRFED